MTTLETSNQHKFGHMNGRVVDTPAPSNHTTMPSAPSHAPLELNAEDPFTPNTRQTLPWLLQLLGLNFTSRGARRPVATGSQGNPYDMGFYHNIRDFWTVGRELDIDYRNLYDVPEGGFRTLLSRRKRQVQSRQHDSPSALGHPTMSSQPYQPLTQEDV